MTFSRRSLFAFSTGVTAVLAFACAGSLAAQTTARGTVQGTVMATSPGTFRSVGGLNIKVRLNESISSKTAAAGDGWDGVLATDLIVAGHLVTPAGTQVTGVVSDAISATHNQGIGKLTLQLTAVRGTGVSSTSVVRTGVNPALTNSNMATAGIPGEAATHVPGKAEGQAGLSEARFAAGAILTFTTE